SDNVSVDVSAVAYFRVTDAVKSVVAIENVNAAINQIAQTTLRKVVGQSTIAELGAFIAREQVAAAPAPPAASDGKPARVTAANGSAVG
ncbi:MAG TPA: SPFH domain-containing protein, partial [Trebonia sp.]